MDTSTTATPRLVTADELAELLTISRSHVYQLAHDGVIPSVKIGRNVRFEVAAVLAALRSQNGDAA